MFAQHSWGYRGNSDFIAIPDTYRITPPFTQRLTICLLTSLSNSNTSPWAEQWMKAPNLLTKINHHISLFITTFLLHSWLSIENINLMPFNNNSHHLHYIITNFNKGLVIIIWSTPLSLQEFYNSTTSTPNAFIPSRLKIY